MNKLPVKCVKCNRTWEKDCVIAWGPDDYSGSLCNSCFLEVISPTIHKKQLRGGNLPCFRRGQAYCDQPRCKYRRWCFDVEAMRKAENSKAA